MTMPTTEPQTAKDELLHGAFEVSSTALVVLDAAGTVVESNARARSLLGEALTEPGTRCCHIVNCGRGRDPRPLAHGCISASALERGRRVASLDFIVDSRSMTVSATPIAARSGVLLEIAPAGEARARELFAAPALEITALGPLSLRLGDRSLNGDWLHHRPGQVFRYLLCGRGHRFPAEELVEAIWPGATRTGLISLRQAIHVLRDRLEPARTKQAPSRFIASRAGGYELVLDDIVIDADDFETEARAALLAADRSPDHSAVELLTRAASLYGGEFLADAPYDDWAVAERDRLRDLAVRVLWELAHLRLAAGELPPASSALQRLVDLEPLNTAAQRELIALMLRRGQYDAAVRRYDALRRKYRAAFGAEPGFVLADLFE